LCIHYNYFIRYSCITILYGLGLYKNTENFVQKVIWLKFFFEILLNLQLINKKVKLYCFYFCFFFANHYYFIFISTKYLNGSNINMVEVLNDFDNFPNWILNLKFSNFKIWNYYSIFILETLIKGLNHTFLYRVK